MTTFNCKRQTRRVTIGGLGKHHGLDKERPLVVSLIQGDLISIRPKGRRTGERQITAFDLYDHLLRCEANCAKMERLRQLKERKAQRLADERQRRAEKRLTRPL